MNHVLHYYERRSITARATAWGVFLAIVGFCLDSCVHLIHLHFHTYWFWERISSNALEGVILGIAVSAFLHYKEAQLKRRFNELGYLNHHIRNSLSVIQMAEMIHITECDARLELVTSACERIRKCIEKISREDDCCVDETHPEWP